MTEREAEGREQQRSSTKKRYILIGDDWELMGNGTGNVASLQFVPALKLMEIARKHDVRLTFMVEVAQQLAHARHQHIPAIRAQKRLWDESVCLMKESGFDVQLHLHSQWIDATYRDGYFHLSDRWNLCRYTPAQQEQLVSESIQYLHALLKPIDPDYKVEAFKAGGWALQPSAALLSILEREGIRLVMGVRKDLHIPSNHVSYLRLEEDTLPYYPDYADIQRVAGKQTPIVVVPLAYYAPDMYRFSRYVCRVLKRKLVSRVFGDDYQATPTPEAVLRPSPLGDKTKITPSLRPYLTHLKIGGESFAYLKASFDAVMNRLRRYDRGNLPICIESHTKQLHHSYRDIDRFFGYVTDKYAGEVEFCDMRTYLRVLQQDTSLVRGAGALRGSPHSDRVMISSPLR